MVEWRLWAKGTALALDFGAVVAALLGLPLVQISSGLRCCRGFAWVAAGADFFRGSSALVEWLWPEGRHLRLVSGVVDVSSVIKKIGLEGC